MKFSKRVFTLILLFSAIIVGLQISPVALAQRNGKDKPHKEVCGAVSDDKIRCHAHVIVDDKGNPGVNKNVVTSASGPYGPAQFQTAYKLNGRDRKSTRLNSSHQIISYAVFCLKKKKKIYYNT